MSLAKLKEIESLKAEKASLGAAIKMRRVKLCTDLINKFTSEFISHLEANDFSVTRNSHKTIATFKDFTLTLIMPNSEETQFGSYPTFELLKSTSKTPYVVKVFPTNVNVIPFPRTQSEIEQLQEDIENYKAFLAVEDKALTYELSYYLDNPKNQGQAAIKAPSLIELIDAVVA